MPRRDVIESLGVPIEEVSADAHALQVVRTNGNDFYIIHDDETHSRHGRMRRCLLTTTDILCVHLDFDSLTLLK